MGKFSLSNKAVEDLTAIWNYTYDKWSEIQADKYYHQLIDCCDQLSIKPEIGRKYNEVDKDLLGFKILEHIIFYKIISSKEIFVVRILHSKMDLKNRIID
ncbi:type II toxin-antitoxin system RelE/ParE family toxin [Pedobacter jejuensis]|uniref:Toxin n=1 Tax=Pedobacter jejuensis TaxID=1268550 RepID=A0A3N0BTZ6_9SPHI|nr:type II toxin-antitoxin system RelE/ParE family toxin [Pedobacter jejuensis]RNL52350.1 type II toxin-antitoxin system RelE/ParE family toxin [Pedobacter jejuensis]